VIFTADHGEGLGENDYWFAHGEYLTDVLVHVPLLVRVADLSPRTRGGVASQLDIVPTVSRLVGLPTDPGAPGRHLLADGSSTVFLATLEDATVPRFGLVAGVHKYVRSRRADRRSGSSGAEGTTSTFSRGRRSWWAPCGGGSLRSRRSCVP